VQLWASNALAMLTGIDEFTAMKFAFQSQPVQWHSTGPVIQPDCFISRSFMCEPPSFP